MPGGPNTFSPTSNIRPEIGAAIQPVTNQPRDEGMSGQFDSEAHSYISHDMAVSSATAPAPRSDMDMLSRGMESLYLFGGLTNDHSVLGDFWKYDIGKRVWSELGGDGTGRPGARCWHTMGVSPDLKKLYLFGGFNGTESLNDLWRYEFGKNQWKLIKPSLSLPSPRDRHSMVVYQKNIIVFGGYGGLYSNDMWRYSTEENSWSQVETSAPSSGGPAPRRSHHAAIVKTTMYMSGGNNAHTVFSDVWAFNFDTSTWALVSSGSSAPRRTRAMLLSDGISRLFTFGGFDSKNYRFDLWSFLEGEGWNRVDPNNDRPVERADFAAAFQKSKNPLDKGRFYLFGGFDGRDRYGDLYLFEVATSEWQLVE
eukprot:c6567_g1_i1.p1 GENE.c6567_g1_i1~~c6567_g1_i1.p1  ORF type:complete len:425 (+),score=81.03 c6567_g1_i1:179-1276(+)